MSTTVNFTKMQEELQWLQDNPAFDERPATLEEFLGEDYLNIAGKVRPRLRAELVEIMGEEVSGTRITRYPLAMITGGIGIGKTTVASIVLPYLCHWVLCLKDPQAFFNLLPGSRIAFMQMSTSESQAAEVVFGDIKARIQYSPWFQNNYPYDTKFTKQIRFPKDIWILPGDSAETTFEGYNILGGIVDEADSHKVTKNKDYAEAGFDTIHARITSRFGDRGFLLVIGQMKKASGFAARKYEELQKHPDAHTVSLAIWESLGPDNFEKDDDGNVKTFFYDPKRKQVIPPALIQLGVGSTNESLMEIPVVYQRDFENNPEKALRDLAGIPPAVGDPFISLTYKIDEARDRWVAAVGYDTPVDEHGQIADWFMCADSLPRVGHIDLAYSGDGDALGFAMGHVPRYVMEEGERKPYIVIDMLLRMQAPAGSEIFIGDIRRIIYMLRDVRNFPIKKITLDGFQSTDTRQQLSRKRIRSEELSVDKQVLPYYDVREALYEDRIEFPKYMVKMQRGAIELTEVAVKEFTELIDEGDKIDHPPKGSKDITDAIAGVVFTLMGERRYRRGTVDMGTSVTQKAQQKSSTGVGFQHPALPNGLGGGMSAPVPPRAP